MNFSKFPFTAVTVSSASPAVITLVDHQLAVDDEVWFEATAMPTGMTADKSYFVINNGITANTFQISLTKGGTAVNTSSTGTTVVLQKQNRARLTPAVEDCR